MAELSQFAGRPRAKLLLVDDRPENLTALEATLERLGQDLYTAGSGRDALKLILQHDFAAILLDVQMPVMDGLEVAAIIRERERSRHVPILFLTAHHDEAQIFRGYEAGAVDYLTKPINPDILRSKVSVFIELSIRAAELQRAMEELRRAEENVRLLNADLERRVQERTAELRRSNDQLRDFAYAAAHDLQEPLRTVASYSQLLQRRFRGQIGSDADEFITFIVQGVNRMSSLLRDLLAYTQMSQRDATNRTAIASEQVLHQAVADLHAAVAETGAVITNDPLPPVFADPSLLRQLLQNLISNAMKYRREGVPPAIHVSAQESADEWCFSVRDNGLGIDPKYHDLVFGVFKRLDPRRSPGTGMGLAICKNVVELHGGRIWVDSVPGQGATFRFNLPKPRTAPADAREF